MSLLLYAIISVMVFREMYLLFVKIYEVEKYETFQMVKTKKKITV